MTFCSKCDVSPFFIVLMPWNGWAHFLRMMPHEAERRKDGGIRMNGYLRWFMDPASNLKKISLVLEDASRFWAILRARPGDDMLTLAECSPSATARFALR